VPGSGTATREKLNLTPSTDALPALPVDPVKVNSPENEFVGLNTDSPKLVQVLSVQVKVREPRAAVMLPVPVMRGLSNVTLTSSISDKPLTVETPNVIVPLTELPPVSVARYGGKPPAISAAS